MNLRAFLWQNLPKVVLTTYADLTMLRVPDRVFIQQAIVPKIVQHRNARALNVGVHYYTVRTHRDLIQGGIELHTADIDPRKDIWGVRGRHKVCGAEDLDRNFDKGQFDFVILNGVLGYGIDDKKHLARSLQSIARIMKQGGILIVGWDENMSEDPLEDTSYQEHFEKDAVLVGSNRVRKPNGLIDRNGNAAFKTFDFLKRTTP